MTVKSLRRRVWKLEAQIAYERERANQAATVARRAVDELRDLRRALRVRSCPYCGSVCEGDTCFAHSDLRHLDPLTDRVAA